MPDRAITEEVPGALDGVRVDRLVALVASVARADAAAVVAAGGVRLDGAVVVSGKQRVRAGQVVEVDAAQLPKRSLPAADPDVSFRVVYADDDVIVVDKPAGLVVHPGAGNPEGTLVNGLLAQFPELATVGDVARPGIVHRLDAGTSGLLVVARTAAAYHALVAAMSARRVQRSYDVLVWGRPEAATGIIEAPIGRDQRDPMRMAVVVGGRPARTRYQVVRHFADPGVTLLRCELETGRTHQIRVHLTATGHPVVGDATYGGNRRGVTSDRPFLHAAHLAFDHPRTGEELHFDAALPADLAEILSGLADRGGADGTGEA